MNEQKTIVWHCLPNESPANRIDRLNKELYRIFFDSKAVCPESFVSENSEGIFVCGLCDAWISPHGESHATPRFLDNLDAMQLIVESGKFAEVREEFFHWLASEGKPAYECTILLYHHGNPCMGTYFRAEGHSRQEAFCLAALTSQGCTVVKEENNEHHEIH